MDRLLLVRELMSTKDTVQMVFYETIERAKKDILCHSNPGNHEKDLIFQYLASWFFEFNQDSTMTMTEFSIQALQSASEAESVKWGPKVYSHVLIVFSFRILCLTLAFCCLFIVVDADS